MFLDGSARPQRSLQPRAPIASRFQWDLKNKSANPAFVPRSRFASPSLDLCHAGWRLCKDAAAGSSTEGSHHVFTRLQSKLNESPTQETWERPRWPRNALRSPCSPSFCATNRLWWGICILQPEGWLSRKTSKSRTLLQSLKCIKRSEEDLLFFNESMTLNSASVWFD